IAVGHVEVVMLTAGGNGRNGVWHHAKLGQRHEAVLAVDVDDKHTALRAGRNTDVEVLVFPPPRLDLIGVGCGASAAVWRGGALVARPTRKNGHAIAG